MDAKQKEKKKRRETLSCGVLRVCLYIYIKREREVLKIRWKTEGNDKKATQKKGNEIRRRRMCVCGRGRVTV